MSFSAVSFCFITFRCVSLCCPLLFFVIIDRTYFAVQWNLHLIVVEDKQRRTTLLSPCSCDGVMWTNTIAYDDPALLVAGRKLLRECRAKRTHQEFQIFPFLRINIKNNIKKVFPYLPLPNGNGTTLDDISSYRRINIFNFEKVKWCGKDGGASGGGCLPGQGWVDVVDVLKCCKRMKKFPRYNKKTRKFLSYHPLSPQTSFTILSIIICLFSFRLHLRFPPHFGVFIFGNIENA